MATTTQALLEDIPSKMVIAHAIASSRVDVEVKTTPSCDAVPGCSQGRLRTETPSRAASSSTPTRGRTLGSVLEAMEVRALSRAV